MLIYMLYEYYMYFIGLFFNIKDKNDIKDKIDCDRQLKNKNCRLFSHNFLRLN